MRLPGVFSVSTKSKRLCVIGLGSMGKRRIRCLQALQYYDILGIDPRQDRREETENLYSITTTDSISNLNFDEIDAIVISTPPDQHIQYQLLAIDYGIPAFVEASILIRHVEKALRYNTNNVFIGPSCTLCFHPLIKAIKEFSNTRKYGKITNFVYNSGQYLPDWHPWEDYRTFYASNRQTGGAREIVPFELTWIIDTLGFPLDIKGYFSKTFDYGLDIDDTYAFLLKYRDKVGSVLVDVASRYAMRNLLLNFENAQIRWNWEDKHYSLYTSEDGSWHTVNLDEGSPDIPYKNFIEQVYIDELKCFLDTIDGKSKFPNSLANDAKVLALLNNIEDSDGGFQ